MERQPITRDLPPITPEQKKLQDDVDELFIKSDLAIHALLAIELERIRNEINNAVDG